MPKAKKVKEVVDAPVEETVAEKPTKSEWPKVDGNGRFQAVKFKDGWVVYNPRGQRATGVVSDDEARNLVLRSNEAASLKG